MQEKQLDNTVSISYFIAMRKYDPSAIRRLRESLGLTLRQFGMQIGATRQYVEQLEKGICRPGVRTLERFMQLFQVTESYFFVDD